MLSVLGFELHITHYSTFCEKCSAEHFYAPNGYPRRLRVRLPGTHGSLTVSPPGSCPYDAPLSSGGSQRTRFPAVNSTMKALRLPAMLPFGSLFSPAGTTRHLLCVCVRLHAPVTPQAGDGPGTFLYGVPLRPFFHTWTGQGLPGFLTSLPMALRSLSDPGRPSSTSPLAVLAVLPPLC